MKPPENAEAIHADGQYLYYSAQLSAAGVWRSNLDGMNPVQIVASIYPSSVVHTTATHLYFSDAEHGGGIYKANKDGTVRFIRDLHQSVSARRQRPACTD